MSSKINDGGAAFPGVEFTPGYGPCTPSTGPNGETIWTQHNQGMTLRDFFAAAALQGNMASFAAAQCRTPTPEAFAKSAYAQADAMLAEREKGKS